LVLAEIAHVIHVLYLVHVVRLGCEGKNLESVAILEHHIVKHLNGLLSFEGSLELDPSKVGWLVLALATSLVVVGFIGVWESDFDNFTCLFKQLS